jgi:hypothetical protein
MQIGWKNRPHSSVWVRPNGRKRPHLASRGVPSARLIKRKFIEKPIFYITTILNVNQLDFSQNFGSSFELLCWWHVFFLTASIFIWFSCVQFGGVQHFMESLFIRTANARVFHGVAVAGLLILSALWFVCCRSVRETGFPTPLEPIFSLPHSFLYPRRGNWLL